MKQSPSQAQVPVSVRWLTNALISFSGICLAGGHLTGCIDGKPPGLLSDVSLSDAQEEIVINLLDAGFPEEEISLTSSGNIAVGGDAMVGLQSSRELVDGYVRAQQVDGDGRVAYQYTTFALVNSDVTTICIAGSGFGSADFGDGLDGAIADWNALNTQLSFRRRQGNPEGCDAEIAASVVTDDPDVPSNSGGIAGFPENGLPFGSVKIGSATPVQNIKQVLIHELGHAVGMRHSDWFNRSISCGVGGAEAADPVGAVHIPGTPTDASQGGSVMNACFNPQAPIPTFTESDIVALQTVYPAP